MYHHDAQPASKQSLYTAEFFTDIEAHSARSAAAVVPLVLAATHPKSVVDVGCGTGAWLAEFRAADVERTIGIDGPYVNRQSLLIPGECFVAADLTKGLGLTERFDLCICLEVAEHLPSSSASVFVASLVDLAPIVLFSAAVPGQTGTGHLNERWPDYWMSLFSLHDYVQLDPFRYQLWQDARVAWWFRQNLFLYVKREHIGHVFESSDCGSALLARAAAARPLLLLHQDIVRRFEATISKQDESLAHLRTGRGAIRILSFAAARLLRRWLRL